MNTYAYNNNYYFCKTALLIIQHSSFLLVSVMHLSTTAFEHNPSLWTDVVQVFFGPFEYFFTRHLPAKHTIKLIIPTGQILHQIYTLSKTVMMPLTKN